MPSLPDRSEVSSSVSDDTDEFISRLNKTITGDDKLDSEERAVTRGRGGSRVVAWIVASVVTAVFIGAIGAIAFLTGTTDREVTTASAPTTGALVPPLPINTFREGMKEAIAATEPAKPAPTPSTATTPMLTPKDKMAKLTAVVEQNSIAGAPFASSPRLCQAVTFTQFVKGESGQPGKLHSVVACLPDK